MLYSSLSDSSNASMSERRDSSVSGSDCSNYGSKSHSGGLTYEQRSEKIKKLWEKKRAKKTQTQKFVRYECRKNLAEKRFRYQGRFVKLEQLALLDPELVFNPSSKPEHKTKPIFKVHK